MGTNRHYRSILHCRLPLHYHHFPRPNEFVRVTIFNPYEQLAITSMSLHFSKPLGTITADQNGWYTLQHGIPRKLPGLRVKVKETPKDEGEEVAKPVLYSWVQEPHDGYGWYLLEDLGYPKPFVSTLDLTNSGWFWCPHFRNLHIFGSILIPWNLGQTGEQCAVNRCWLIRYDMDIEWYRVYGYIYIYTYYV